MSDVTDPTARLFDQWARDGQAERMQAGHLARASQALEALPIAPGQRLLDLGCGNGWATRMLHARAGATGWCYGVDAAPDMIARAREQSALLDRIEFQVATFDALPWPDDHFAHAFSFEALYYAPDLAAALAEVHRVLQPGGTLVAGTDFYAENPTCLGWPERMGVPMTLLSEQGWVDALAAAGFEVERTFRCLDPRPVDPAWPEAKRLAEERFRSEIGSLALVAVAG
ncbi:MAG: methyltransferase domain-containing protein [Planctomycetes bacterium]|nr:methyltransferase domain-containing protein [Planctomycetota bacterium]